MKAKYALGIGLAAIALLIVALRPETAQASNAIAKQENLACTSCHDKPGSRLLTDQGKYYEVFDTLAGYEQLTASFGRCTACHSRKPGSVKLTQRGRRYRSIIDDMEELRELLMQPHPELPDSTR